MGAERDTPERKAVNSHLWRMHRKDFEGASGRTEHRIGYHEWLHAVGSEDGFAGSPLHRHIGGTIDFVGEVVLHEGEGT
jgi:hypothetical protein